MLVKGATGIKILISSHDNNMDRDKIAAISQTL